MGVKILIQEQIGSSMHQVRKIFSCLLSYLKDYDKKKKVSR